MTPGGIVPITESEVKFWFKEIESSEKRMRDEFIARINYNELVEYYEGIQKGKAASIDTLIVLDEISPSINSIIKTAYYQNPSVQVKSASPIADGMVKPSLLYMIQNPDFKPFSLTSLMEGAIRYGMEKGGAKDAMQVATFDLLTAGFAVAEVNIEAQNTPGSLGNQPTDDTLNTEPNDGQEPNLFEKAFTKVKDLLGVKDDKTDEETEHEVIEKQSSERIGIKGTTYWSRWRPDHVLFDSRANTFAESRFIGKVVYKSLADFKVMFPDYKDDMPSGDQLHEITYAQNKAEKEKRGLPIYELQIKRMDEQGNTYIQVLKLAKGIKGALSSTALPFSTNGFTLKYATLDKYGKLYPISRVKKAKKSQDDLNNLATIQMEHALRASRKIAYDENALTPAGINALKSSDVYALIPKNRPSAIFEPIPVSNVPTDNPLLQAALGAAINKQIGSNEIAKSGESKNEFATQDQLESQSFEVQVSQVQDAIGDLAEACIDCEKDIIQQLWDDEIYFKVTGIQGATAWYDPAMGSLPDIAIGDYLVVADIISASKPNPMKSRNEAIEFATFITNPAIQQYCMMRGKTTSITVIENVIKQFNQDPDMILQNLDPLAQPMLPPISEPKEGANKPKEGKGEPNITPVPMAGAQGA